MFGEVPSESRSPGLMIPDFSHWHPQRVDPMSGRRPCRHWESSKPSHGPVVRDHIHQDSELKGEHRGGVASVVKSHHWKSGGLRGRFERLSEGQLKDGVFVEAGRDKLRNGLQSVELLPRTGRLALRVTYFSTFCTQSCSRAGERRLLVGSIPSVASH